jgi:hypothetical protein
MDNFDRFRKEVFAKLKKFVKGFVDVHYETNGEENYCNLIVCIKYGEYYFKKTRMHIADYISNGGTADDLVRDIIDQYKSYIFNRYFLRKPERVVKYVPIQDPGGYYPPEPLKAEDIVSFEATEET